MSGDVLVIAAEVEVPLEILSKTLRLQVRKQAQCRHTAGCGRAELEFMLLFLKLGQKCFWGL